MVTDKLGTYLPSKLFFRYQSWDEDKAYSDVGNHIGKKDFYLD